MDRNNNIDMYKLPLHNTNKSTNINTPLIDSNVSYVHKSAIHENYWFQDLSNSIFNLDYALKIFPNTTMTYAEKINSIVRLGIYIGLILALLYKNYMFLYIPITIMILSYLMYIFRIDQLNTTLEHNGPISKINSLLQTNLNDLTKHNMATSYDTYNSNGVRVNNDAESFTNILNIKNCSKPSTLNPFMNPLVFDSRMRDSACDAIKEENQLQIEKEYNKYCIKDVSDIFNHNSGRRQFYTVASTTYPNNQGGFANWLYKTPPTCKEGNGAQCIANYYVPLSRNTITPGYGSATSVST